MIDPEPRPSGVARLACGVAALLLLLTPSAAPAADSDPEPAGPITRSDRRRLVAPEQEQLFSRPDEKRPTDQRSMTLFGRPLTVGGEVELRTRFDGDFRLDPDIEDDEVRTLPKLEVEAAYGLSERAFLYAEGKVFFRTESYREDGNRHSELFFERGESWFYLGQIHDSPFSLQIGRQRFNEKREWFWDEDLDAIRLHYDREQFHWEVAVARRLTRVSSRNDQMDPTREDVTRWLSRADWEWRPDHHFELFFLNERDTTSSVMTGQVVDREDEDPSDAKLTWFGLRFRGECELGELGKLAYWADGATVKGRETAIDFDTNLAGQREADDVVNHSVQGWAADVGVTLETEAPGRPSITLGYAEGSGDRNMDEESQSGFRQSGIEDNNTKFSGVNRFRYYGELLRPELSNLRVFTAAIGFPLLDSSSIEFLYHAYRQVHSAPELRGDRLDTEPVGRSRTIGQALDVALGLEEWEHLEIELVGSVFKAGSAFAGAKGRKSWFGELKVKYNY